MSKPPPCADPELTREWPDDDDERCPFCNAKHGELRAENGRLREALKPFAAEYVAQMYDEEPESKKYLARSNLKVGDFRHARDLLR